MGKARILKKGEHGYIELPPEFLAYEDAELFQLRDGYYLLSLPLGTGTRKAAEDKAPRQARQKTLSDAERGLLLKLLNIRFEKRTPSYVTKSLSEAERAVLKELESKNYVNVFTGTKYRDGVYNINDDVYPLISGRPDPQKAVPHKPAQETAVRKDAQLPQSPYRRLMDRGFIVLENKNDARDFSEKVERDIKSGAIKGIKGFDGRFYAVTSGYLSKASEAILKALDRDMDLDTLAAQAGLDRDGCSAVLRLLSESGEVIEKKKGLFAAV